MHHSRIASAVAVLVLAGGCDWWLRITEVGGTVRVDGKPAAGVTLVFEPLAPRLPRAIAQTGRDGTYRLGRQGPGARSGAASGRYRVRLTADTEREGGVMIPANYNVNSTLEFEVVPGKPNEFDIDVTTRK